MSIDLKLPWSLAPLEGKYYGTDIVDSEGTVIASIWRGASNDDEYQPSPREDIDEDEITDNHYENMRTFKIAEAIVMSVNEWKADEKP